MTEQTETKAVNAKINEIKRLLDTKFDHDPTHRKKIVLIVGVTGTGKSTACQFLADNPNLRAEKKVNSILITFTDGNVKVSASITESKTLLPELVPIPNTSTVLADCPGFNDTRSAQYDIAAAVFIKKLLSESEQVKIMVTTHHNSVQPNDRLTFINLLTFVVNFIKDIGKYKDSIGLLVTKVDITYVKDENDTLSFTSDIDVIAEIGEFMQTVKAELNTKKQKSKDKMVLKQIELIDVFLEKNYSDNYTKIGIFRRPENKQELGKNKNLTENKIDINNIIHNVLKFKCVTPDDFGLSLSHETLNFIFQFRESITANSSKILNEYINEYQNKLLGSKPDNIDDLKAVIVRCVSIVNLLEEKIDKNMKVIQLIECFEQVDSAHPTKQYADWKKEQQYLLFLESIDPTEECSSDYDKYHLQLVDFKNRMRAEIKAMESNAERMIDEAIVSGISEVIKEIMNKILEQAKFFQTEFFVLAEQISKINKLCFRFKNNSFEINVPFEEFLNRFVAVFITSEDQILKFATLQKSIEFFKSKLNPTFSDGHQEQWLHGFNTSLEDMASLFDRYSLLAESQEKPLETEEINMRHIVTEPTGTRTNIDRINDTKRLLDSKFDLDETLRKNIILFIGLTGSGTSTVCQFLGDNTNLKAVKREYFKEFFITDGNVKVSESTTESKTLLPELVPIPHTNTVLADCPGIDETRSPQYDIAAAFFIKKMLSESEQVKIMITTPHHAVRPNLDHRHFNELLFNVAYFIGDIEKYKESIGLVVTKVDNLKVEDENVENILRPDKKSIAEIGVFLNRMKTELIERNNRNESSLVLNQIKLIDIFLAKNSNDDYSKISIFRRPLSTQALSKDRNLVQNKMDIKNIICNVLKFTCVKPHDFRTLLSHKTLTFIDEFRETLNKNLFKILEDYINEYNQKMFAFTPDNFYETKFAVLRPLNVKNVLESNIVGNMEVIQLMQCLAEVDPEHPAQQYADWKQEQQYMQFLESIDPTEEGDNDFEKYNTRLEEFKIRISNEIKITTSELRETVNTNLSKILNGYMGEYYQKLFGSSPANVDETKALLKRFLTIVKVLESKTVENMEVAQLMKCLEEVDPDHPVQQYAEWKKEQQYVQLLQSIDPTEDFSNDFENYNTRLNDLKIRISNEIKITTLELLETVNTNLSKILDRYMDEYYQKLFGSPPANVDETKAVIIRSRTIVRLLESNTIEDMEVAHLMECIEEVDPWHPAQQYAEWKTQREHLQFLETIDPTMVIIYDFEIYNTRLKEFKIRISKEIKLIISKWRHTVNTNLARILDRYMDEYYQKLFGTPPANVDETKAVLIRSLTIVKVLESKTVENMKVAHLMQCIGELDPEHPAQQYAEWKTQREHMQFLESIDHTGGRSNEYEEYKTRLENFKNRISETSKLLENKMIDKHFENYF